MTYPQLFTLDPAHLAGTKLGNTISVFRKCRGRCRQISFYPAVLRLGTGAHKGFTAQFSGKLYGINGITDIIRLQPCIIPGVSNRGCPAKMIKYIAGRNVCGIQLLQLIQTTLYNVHQIIPGYSRGPRRTRSANSVNLNLIFDTFLYQCNPYRSGGSGHGNSVHLTSPAFPSIINPLPDQLTDSLTPLPVAGMVPDPPVEG